MPGRLTPLYDVHQERDATFTDFGGWEMPVEFASIRVEHEAVRESIGVFDVSHMGQIEVSGSGAADLCQRLVTSDVSSLDPGGAQYTTILHEDGTLIDDAIMYRLEDDRFLLVPNAGKDEVLTDRWSQYGDDWDMDAAVRNRTTDWGMLAVQGPEASSQLPDGASDIDPMTIRNVRIAGIECLCARTGYTGEDGFELLVPWDETPMVDRECDGTRCGLGARDTLRLEMGFVLAGNEFDQETNRRTPFEAGLEFVVDMDAEPPFVGWDSLEAEHRSGVNQQLSGLLMVDRGIPRTGYAITDGDGEKVGTVTSGTMSPTLGEPIGLGYVDCDHAEAGSGIAVEIRGSERKASIVTPPFVDTGR